MLSKHSAFLIIFLSQYSLRGIVFDLKTAKNSLITILQKERHDCVKEFQELLEKYDKIVLDFFDKKNNDSLKTHISRMEIELHSLKKVYEDVRYCSITALLKEHYGQLEEVVSLLKRYIGSHDAFSLALEVQKYKPILPEPLQKKSNVSLFSCLRHRLKCGG